MNNKQVPLDTIVNLAKRRGFVFPGSAIYGGLSNSWDYGPLGVLLKNNLRDAWWMHFVRQRQDMVGLDAAILMNPKVWEASGHVANFNDPMVDCKNCHNRFRADHLVQEASSEVNTDAMDLNRLSEYIQNNEDVKCTQCGKREFTNVRRFNLMFETSLGTLEDKKQSVYLRGELAQSMFVDFKLIMDSMRKNIPFGIAQTGKVFRNEITPGNFTFRTLEFDLMEFEYFIQEEKWEEVFEYWLKEMRSWLKEIGFRDDNLRVREHEQEELSHYSKKTVDIEYKTSFGWKELFGLAYRTDFDLKNHMEKSGEDLRATDPETGDKFIPHVIEPTFGLTRLTLMTMLEAYSEENVKGEKRVVMKFHPKLAPFQAAVLPLSKKEDLIRLSEGIAGDISGNFSCDHDVTQSIGKRYRRQDEIGTPYCITVDFESLEDNAVTVRNRDTMEQERIPIIKVKDYINDKINA